MLSLLLSPQLNTFLLPEKVCLTEVHLYIDLFLDFGLSLVVQAFLLLSYFLTLAFLFVSNSSS